MRTEAPLLLPIFRSDGQGRLLARVYLGANRPAPLADLARELQIDAGGLTREADRLERAGLVRSKRVGRQRLLEPNTDSPFYADLHALLLKAFGPATVIAPLVAALEGVERAFIFGSWAARYRGERGPDPVDVDLMLVGRPVRSEVARITRVLTDELAREINATIISSRRWSEGSDGFVREVRRGPTVELDLDRVREFEP